MRRGRGCCLVKVVVTGERARIGRTIVSDGESACGTDYINVEVDEPFAGNASVLSAHSMGRVTSGTGEAIVNVAGVLAETGIVCDLAEVVTLCAHRVRAIHGEVRIREEVGDGPSGSAALAEFVTSF